MRHDPPRQRERERFRAAEARFTEVDPAVRNELVIAYLDGEASAVWVLADFAVYAELPAIKPASLDQRVRYVLALLPPTLAHTLACDFVDHLPELAGIPAPKRGWLEGTVSDTGLAQARARVRPRSWAPVLSSSPAPFVAQRVCKLVQRTVGHPMSADWREEVAWQVEHVRTTLTGG